MLGPKASWAVVSVSRSGRVDRHVEPAVDAAERPLSRAVAVVRATTVVAVQGWSPNRCELVGFRRRDGAPAPGQEAQLPLPQQGAPTRRASDIHTPMSRARSSAVETTTQGQQISRPA